MYMYNSYRKRRKRATDRCPTLSYGLLLDVARAPPLNPVGADHLERCPRPTPQRPGRSERPSNMPR